MLIAHDFIHLFVLFPIGRLSQIFNHVACTTKTGTTRTGASSWQRRQQRRTYNLLAISSCSGSSWIWSPGGIRCPTGSVMTKGTLGSYSFFSFFNLPPWWMRWLGNFGSPDSLSLLPNFRFYFTFRESVSSSHVVTFLFPTTFFLFCWPHFYFCSS